MQVRNQHCKPKQEVPIGIRLEVYKEVLDLIKKYPQYDKHDNMINEEQYEGTGRGLCILLPCKLWNLRHNMLNSDGSITFHKDWYYYQTPIMFPELCQYLSQLSYSNGYEKYLLRIEFLEAIINNIEHELFKTK